MAARTQMELKFVETAKPLPRSPQRIVYGVFKGMGDLLSAAPVIASLLNRGDRVWLLCFPGKGLAQLTDLIDFGPCRENLTILELPVGPGWVMLKRFAVEIQGLAPDLVWVSPHASRRASSWKVPVFLWLLRAIFWRGARIAGARSERLSSLFDLKVPVDRKLPLKQRELAAYAMIDRAQPEAEAAKVVFIDRIREAASEQHDYDLLIHPGANAPNRSWPTGHYAQVVRLIPATYRIAVLGLPEDVAALRRELPADRGIDYLTGSLEDALQWIARSRVVLTMDSGNVHFASVLGVPAVALFGKADPATIIAPGGSVLPIYQPSRGCQPCERVSCNQAELYCMNRILPDTVAKAVLRLMAS